MKRALVLLALFTAVGCRVDFSKPCYSIVGAAGQHLLVLDQCSGELLLRAIPFAKDPTPSTTTTTTLRKQEV